MSVGRSVGFDRQVVRIDGLKLSGQAVDLRMIGSIGLSVGFSVDFDLHLLRVDHAERFRDKTSFDP